MSRFVYSLLQEITFLILLSGKYKAMLDRVKYLLREAPQPLEQVTSSRHARLEEDLLPLSLTI